jgi:aminoglycoside phosphotransferase (APT) family kinase protein
VPAVLAQSQVAHYLVALGLVNPGTVVGERLTVLDASRRNSVFVVSTPETTFVVKQAGHGCERTLAHEAEVLRAVARLRIAPELVHYDAAAVRLVLRSPAGAVAWGDQRRVPRLAAAALGRALATIHAAALDVPTPAGVDRLWGLPEPPLERLRDMSDGALGLLAAIQGSCELCDRLHALRETAAGAGFVHGDLRWENSLAVPAPGSTRRSRVLLIDWELAGAGDPAIDVGTALAEYLRLWVDSVPLADPADPARLLRHARFPLERLRPAMQALWSGYRRAATRPIALRRVVEMAAVRLLEAGLEQAHELGSPSFDGRRLLQLADNLLRTPEHAAWSLLGLHE